MHRGRLRSPALALAGLSALAVVASAAGTYLSLRNPNVPSTPPVAATSNVASRADAPPPLAANAPPAPRANAPALATAAADRATALRDALSWQDDAARIDAIEAAIASGATETLPVLEHVVLREDPEGAPTIIHAVAVLGARAGAATDAGRDAAQTLAAWLSVESGREGADARGNVSVLVDALGDLGGADASRALATALDRDTLPLHVETLVAQRLTALGDPSAREAIARFQARVAALPPTDGIDESLRKEALALASDVQP